MASSADDQAGAEIGAPESHPDRKGVPVAIEELAGSVDDRAGTEMHPPESHADREGVPVAGEALASSVDAATESGPDAELALASANDYFSVKPDTILLSIARTEGNFERQVRFRCFCVWPKMRRLFRAEDGRFLAQVPVGERFEIYGLKSRGLRDWLIAGYQAEQNEPPPRAAIQRVVDSLEAQARFDSTIPTVFVRVGRGGDDEVGAPFWLDVGDESGQAIRIGADGWCIVKQPGVNFRRPEGLLPLPLPTHGGSIDLLRPYVNLTEPDFRLLVTWLTAALLPVGPYPILVLQGEQGSAKSTLARVLRLLIDPQACPLLAPPKSTRDLVATAVNGWLLAYDNVSTIPPWLSDAFCQLVFGLGFASRTLFTNDERSVIYARRPVILNGIEDFVTRGDMRDRCVFLHLPRITPVARLAEEEFWRAFRADGPRILGGLLDGIVAAVRGLPSVSLAESPRMADYARWGEAFARGAGWGDGMFLATYNVNRKEATEAILDESPLAKLLLKVVQLVPIWTDPPAKMYATLTNNLNNKIAASARWPKSIAAFSNELRRLAPQLGLHGCSVTFGRNHAGRTITINAESTSASQTPPTGSRASVHLNYNTGADYSVDTS